MIFPAKVQPGEHPTAAKFNDLVDFVRRIRPIPGNGTRIEQTPGGSVIHASGGSSTPAPGGPFALRHHVDQWEIYLPPGCVAMRERPIVVNAPASETSGHDDDDSGWYRLYINEEWAGGDPTTFDVNIHVKASCMRAGVDTLDDGGHCAIIASADLRGGYSSAEENARHRWGDLYCQTVGAITLASSFGAISSRKSVRTVDHALQFWCPPPSNYDLLWSISDDDAAEGYQAKLSKLYCLRQSSSMAGVTVVGETMTEIALASEHVYAVIDTTSFGATGSSAENVVTVANAPSTSGSTLTTTNLLLYDLDSGVVTADYRATALANVQAYR